jgi:hypothetical protein
MTFADLTAGDWLALSGGEAERIAATIARQVGARHELHDRTAFFERDGLRFALVPGGTVSLGFDPDRFTPSARLRDGFAAAKAEFGLPGTVGEYIAGTTSPAREVTVPALLIATKAQESGWLILDDEDDDPDDDGHAWVTAGMARRGLRLPTPDEWEHACGAGATTLFRWGDDYPDGEPYGDVPLLKEPNRFGLVIADDPYNAEFTAERDVFCGGDGGTALCGGNGAFLSWLSVATAYRDANLAEAVYDGGLTEETPARPVLELR